jgi:hypothetical protein
VFLTGSQGNHDLRVQPNDLRVGIPDGYGSAKCLSRCASEHP